MSCGFQIMHQFVPYVTNNVYILVVYMLQVKIGQGSYPIGAFDVGFEDEDLNIGNKFTFIKIINKLYLYIQRYAGDIPVIHGNIH